MMTEIADNMETCVVTAASTGNQHDDINNKNTSVKNMANDKARNWHYLKSPAASEDEQVRP